MYEFFKMLNDIKREFMYGEETDDQIQTRNVSEYKIQLGLVPDSDYSSKADSNESSLSPTSYASDSDSGASEYGLTLEAIKRLSCQDKVAVVEITGRRASNQTRCLCS